MRPVGLFMRAKHLAPLISFICAVIRCLKRALQYSPIADWSANLAVLAFYFLMLSWLSGQQVLAQGLIGAPTGHLLAVGPAEQVIECAKDNSGTLLITVLILLKVAIPFCARYDWWKRTWCLLSYSVPFFCGAAVHFVYLGLSADSLFKSLVTGMTFGIACLATAALHRRLTGDNDSELTMKPS